MREQARVPDCDHCEAWDENPADFVERELCPLCPHSREVMSPIIHTLLRYRAMIEAGCPVGRHELTNREWIQLGAIRAESEKLALKDAEEKNKKG